MMPRKRPSDPGDYVELTEFENGKDDVKKKMDLYLDWGEDDPVPYNLWTYRTMAVPLIYITVGFLISFPNAYIQFYPRQLGASDSQLSTIGTVRALPWTFKFLYGLCADTLPIRGYRFKPYMIIGLLISSLFCALMAWIQTPDLIEFTMLLLGIMFGTLMADVMGDALVASKARLEPLHARGDLQAKVYGCRFASEVVGYCAGAILSNEKEWGWGLSLAQTFAVMALLPLLLTVPAVLIMAEDKVDHIKPLRDQARGIWNMIQMRAVWQPLAFIALFNSLNVYNASWGNYIEVAYHFSAFQYGFMSAAGSIVTILGVLVYRKYFLHTDNWQMVYLLTTCAIKLFAIMNIMLVFKVNDIFGIPAYWFAMGDSAILHFAYGIQFLPSAIMFVTVCPEEQEGLAFASLTSFQNLAGGMASTISNLLLGLWPVQLSDLQKGNYDGVWKLTVLANCIGLIPLFFLPLLPVGVSALEQLKKYSSYTGGVSVFVGFILGFIWVVVLSLLAVIEPCHRIVGGDGCQHSS